MEPKNEEDLRAELAATIASGLIAHSESAHISNKIAQRAIRIADQILQITHELDVVEEDD